jgi:hypothetical protein
MTNVEISSSKWNAKPKIYDTGVIVSTKKTQASPFCLYDFLYTVWLLSLQL